MTEVKRLNIDSDELDVEHQSNEFAELFSASLKEQKDRPERDKIVEGTVVRVDQDMVLVDVGRKSEGFVPIAEFKDANGAVCVAVGDKVRLVASRDGANRFSRKRAEQMAAWEKIHEAGGEGAIVEGTIVAKTNGGFTVDIGGINAFLPASQVDIRPSGNGDAYIGVSGSFKIINLNQKRGNIVLSRRSLLEEERAEARKATLEKLAEGQILPGVVKNLTEYGAFVDLGGVDGLLHVTDISWGRVGKPADVLKPGQEVMVKVLKYDPEKGKVSVGIKQTQPDPWQNLADRFPVGTRINGRVVSLMEYGAFVEIEAGIEGLVHVSEMSWTKRVRKAADVLSVGDQVEVVVLGVDLQNRKISLGLKQTTENPWASIVEKYPIGTTLEGQIKNMTDFGMFIGIEEGIDGLVHVSDISWTKRIKHPGDVYSKGDLVQAVVLKVDPQNERISLGIKQLTPDPWSLVPQKYTPGTRLVGKVASTTDFGVFVEIEEGIEGLIHVSELSREKVPSAKDFAKVGDEIEAVVLSADSRERRISLSVKALAAAAEKAEFESYLGGGQGEATSNLGELLKNRLEEKANE
ncbi:30S ribosomal protein S1 [Trichlorobacter ammonificans]|uniref:Small ribosomal subunit protein bS1 n=1 Tax=Trichlorobacter ammonificans TaxID=2916410 RepID=A0ABM9D7B3_9BACT|nr:30S ribosomal protein S1 [Trichlorobacter ammonificans]CAH2031120.1 30S ribosomal subunit protein S1 [Trichlorobacter ammonificans]